MSSEEFIGEVIDNDATNSPDGVENGAVQLYIPSIMQDISANLYPWFLPTSEWSNFIPEIGDFIWCKFLDIKNWRLGFYGDSVSLREAFSHTSAVGSMVTEYPDTKYITLKNDVSLAMSSNENTPEVSIFHPGGAEIYIDPDGQIIIKNATAAGASITLGTDGSISIQGGAGVLENSLLGQTTTQLLSDFLDGIIALTVSVPAAPGFSSPPVNIATFTALKATLNTLLSQEVKNS